MVNGSSFLGKLQKNPWTSLSIPARSALKSVESQSHRRGRFAGQISDTLPTSSTARNQQAGQLFAARLARVLISISRFPIDSNV
jgi:hypothetical protein